MIEEFAIDPECFAEKEILSILRECGFSKGRVICEFPRKHWGASIRDIFRARNVSDGDQERIVALLQKLKHHDKAFVRRVSTGNEANMSWLGKACVEHGKHPFKSILSTSNPESKAFVIELDKAWDDDSAWKVETSMLFQMSAPEFVKRTCPLLRHSKTVRFIDAYLTSLKPKALERIKLALECAAKHRTIAEMLKVEIHLCFRDKDLAGDKNAIRDEFSRLVKKTKDLKVFPSGTDVALIAWPNFVTDKMKFHNRHVLTERGGITFGSSFNDSYMDQAKIQEPPEHEELWRSFTAPDKVPCPTSKVLQKLSFKF